MPLAGKGFLLAGLGSFIVSYTIYHYTYRPLAQKRKRKAVEDEVNTLIAMQKARQLKDSNTNESMT